MRRTYLAKRNIIFSRENLSWGRGALAFALFALVFRIIAPDAFAASIGPLARFSNALSARTAYLFSSFADAAALSKENETLVNESLALASKNQALTQRVADLTALLGNVSTPTKSIVASVILRPPESPYDSLLVDLGSRDGVTLHMLALGPGDVPLGTVIELHEQSARVELYSAPGKETNGWVGNTKIPLTIIGRGGGALEATISRSALIEIGDIVYVAGHGALPIGSVVRIDGDASSPGVVLRIQNATNVFSIIWVELRDI